MHLDDRERDAFAEIASRLSRSDPRFRRRMSAGHDRLDESYSRASFALLYAVVLLTGAVLIIGITAGLGFPFAALPGLVFVAVAAAPFSRWLMRPTPDRSPVERSRRHPPA